MVCEDILEEGIVELKDVRVTLHLKVRNYTLHHLIVVFKAVWILFEDGLAFGVDRMEVDSLLLVLRLRKSV